LVVVELLVIQPLDLAAHLGVLRKDGAVRELRLRSGRRLLRHALAGSGRNESSRRFGREGGGRKPEETERKKDDSRERTHRETSATGWELGERRPPVVASQHCAPGLAVRGEDYRLRKSIHPSRNGIPSEPHAAQAVSPRFCGRRTDGLRNEVPLLHEG